MRGDEALAEIVRRLEADLRTRFVAITVRLERGDEDQLILDVRDGGDSWGQIETWLDDDQTVFEEHVEQGLLTFAQEIADNLWSDELTEPWPECAVHGDHPLQPRLVRGTASWACTKDGSVAIPIGSLEHP